MKKMYSIKNINHKIEYDFNDEKIDIRFFEKEIDFSELSTIRFVMASYKNVCLLLVAKLKEYSIKNGNEVNKYIVSHFLPMMFCFRHYVELKIKYLYMWYYGESFKNTHQLYDLLTELQKAQEIKFPIFNKIISFIEKYEKLSFLTKNDESYFRYLASKDFKVEKNITISIDDIFKISGMINDLEFRVDCIMQNDWLHKGLTK